MLIKRFLLSRRNQKISIVKNEALPHILLCLTIVYIDDQMPQDLKVPSSKSMAPTEHKHNIEHGLEVVHLEHTLCLSYMKLEFKLWV